MLSTFATCCARSAPRCVVEVLEDRISLSGDPGPLQLAFGDFNNASSVYYQDVRFQNNLTSYGVFAMSGSKIDITNPSTKIGGDVGIAAGGIQNCSDGIITGRLVLDPTANNTKSNNLKIQGGTVRQSLAKANQLALDVSSEIAGMAPTQTFSSIGGSKVINSTGHINVIKTGSIALSGSAIITLNANDRTDYFFINVTGKFAMTGSSQIRLAGGISSTHVIFNIVGTGEQVAFTGSSVGVGTFIAVNRDIAVSGATVKGVLIGAMNHKIAITSGAQIQVGEPHFDPSGLDWFM